MALFGRSRRDAPPAALVSLLRDDERVVSWADVEGGGVVGVSRLGLWWPDGDGYRRIGWEYVVKAVWRDTVLSVVEGDVVDDTLLVDRPPVAVRLSVPRDLPPTVRKRVEANIVQREELAVPGGTVHFVARRRPGHDGLVWWAHLAAGAPDTPGLRQAIAARLRTLRASGPREVS